MKPATYGLALVLLFFALVARAESVPGASVEELLAIARQQSPEFAALRLDAEAAAERVQPAGALADPTLRMELQNVTNSGTDAAPSVLPDRVGSTKYTLIQPLPFWGKRDLKHDAAAAEADAARGRTSLGWNDLAARIKTVFAQGYALARQVALTREVMDLVERLESVSRARYAGGLAPQADAVRARVERTSLQTELVQLETEHHHAMLRMNALLARPREAPLAAPQSLRPLPPAARLDISALEARLRERNPQLFADAAAVRAAEKNRDLAYRNRYPDFALGISPIQTRRRVNEWELMVEVNIPLQQESRRSQEREAERMVEAAGARREASANRLLDELGENLAALETAQRLEKLARADFLPQAELAFQSALAGYENGRVDFATLLDAQRQIRNAKLNVIKAQTEQQARLADIERLIGEDL
jgi:cobalt-zinc-cadmium efflux system outer membrane protein